MATSLLISSRLLLRLPHVVALRPGVRLLHHGVPSLERVQFHLSDIGEGIKEVTIKEWFVKPGDTIAQFDQLCEVQSDKASVTITSRFDGVVAKLHFQVDDVAQTGDALVDIETEASANVVDEEKEDDKEKESSSSSSSSSSNSDSETVSMPSSVSKVVGKILATPAVRRIASEHKINLGLVKGSGKNGRVLKEDLIHFLEGRESKEDVQKTPAHSVSPPSESPISSSTASSTVSSRRVVKSGEERLTGVRRAMFRSMTQSLSIPHFGYSEEVVMDNLVKTRQLLKDQSSKQGVKLTFMPFLLKAASLALLDYPILNAALDTEKETLIYRTEHNLGVAMDTPQGLLVPSIKGVENLSLFDIARELNRLQDLGMNNKLGLEELSNVTFTLSNIGVVGGTYTSPVITAPNVAIGALGQTRVVAKFDDDDNVYKANVMNVSWSADHRVIDGVTIAQFSNRWKQYIENPASMMLHLR